MKKFFKKNRGMIADLILLIGIVIFNIAVYKFFNDVVYFSSSFSLLVIGYFLGKEEVE